MGNGDPVTQKQFYETMNGSKKEILDAVEKVNGSVKAVDDKANATNLTVVAMDAKLKRVDDLDKKVDSLRAWDRVDSIVSGVVAVTLAALGINRGE
ncbi:MAG: hypothetical protein ACYSUC_11575 [Planctomycetota bacterium]|jgi:hypothetical protein